MIAKLQHVIYGEWLPVVLGCEVMARYDLTPRKTGYYDGYDGHCDARYDVCGIIVQSNA